MEIQKCQIDSVTYETSRTVIDIATSPASDVVTFATDDLSQTCFYDLSTTGNLELIVDQATPASLPPHSPFTK